MQPLKMSCLLDMPSDWQNLIASCPSVVTTHFAKSDSNFLASFFVFADNFESTTEYLFTTIKGAGADLVAALTTDLGEGLELTPVVDFLEPKALPQTLFSMAVNVSFIAVFAISQPTSLHLAFFTHDKISLLHCLLLVSEKPQQWSCILQHASREFLA